MPSTKIKLISVKELQAFRATLPEYRQHEAFQYFAHCFDVVKAQYLIQRENLQTNDIDVKGWAKALNLDYPSDSNSVPLLSVTIDSDFVNGKKQELDINRPLIVCYTQVGRGKEKQVYPILIDGSHRLRYAFLNGIEFLKAYVIPFEMTKLVKM